MLLTVPKAPIREALTRLSARLCARTPQTLWLLLIAETEATAIGLASPVAAARATRIAALIADRERIVDSDAETVRLLAAANGSEDLATHARYAEILGRDVISRRFFRTLERCVAHMSQSATAGTPALRDEIALLYVSRLLFLAFLEAK